tara:strand:+ start:39 stop:1163 length:1125 start_codon:yes stop_codon:yes gene_type:complete
MSKSYYSLGLMSGTSMDGVDASIIQTDGKAKYKAILDKYFQYPKNIHHNLVSLRDKIKSLKDLKKHQKQIKSVEKEITIFHANAANKVLKNTKVDVDFIGFHGQTIFHNAKEKKSKQLGNGKLLSKLTKKKVVYNFRQNDLNNGGEGAPLAPIFHKLLVEQKKISLPVIILNLGGIANYTLIWYKKEIKKNCLISKDTGPGNCLIDHWIRKKSKKLFDKNGKIAYSGKINIKIINQALNDSLIENSYDIKDFNLSVFNKLSFKDGISTLTEYTAETILASLNDFLEDHIYNWYKSIHILISGGGRKNKFLVSRIKKKTLRPVKLIDDLNINGDFVESQAFAYLAIRSHLKLPISFPDTTGCNKPCTGGVLVKCF